MDYILQTMLRDGPYIEHHKYVRKKYTSRGWRYYYDKPKPSLKTKLANATGIAQYNRYKESANQYANESRQLSEAKKVSTKAGIPYSQQWYTQHLQNKTSASRTVMNNRMKAYNKTPMGKVNAAASNISSSTKSFVNKLLKKVIK